jgi:2-oxoacid dehydrogenases acyltransferase (catalytic domain)/e3 binding domain
LVKVGAVLVEFDEGPATDTGTVVGEIDRGEPSAQGRAPPAAPAARVLQVVPAIRALARKLDVDLNLVQGTGPGGAITRADVERAAKSLVELGPAEPLRGMRRAMAQRMAAAHAEVARTTVIDEADIDDWSAGEDITIRLVRAIACACKAEPSLNTWYNAEAGERRLLSRIDLGIAVDTEGGLIVPVLRNVGERPPRDLRAGLDRMRADAAARSIPPEELRGATISLSNFGMIGGRFANHKSQSSAPGGSISEWWRTRALRQSGACCRSRLPSIIARSPAARRRASWWLKTSGQRKPFPATSKGNGSAYVSCALLTTENRAVRKEPCAKSGIVSVANGPSDFSPALRLLPQGMENVGQQLACKNTVALWCEMLPICLTISGGHHSSGAFKCDHPHASRRQSSADLRDGARVNSIRPRLEDDNFRPIRNCAVEAA